MGFEVSRFRLVAGKPKARRYRCRYILNAAEIGLPSDEVVVTAQTVLT